MFDDPLSDIAFPAAGIAGEQRRSVKDYADAAAPFFRAAHLRQHVLEKKQRAVVDARQAGAEAAFIAVVLGFIPDEFFLLFPFHAERRIGQHVIEGVLLPIGVALKGVFREGVAETDLVGIFALDEHV